VTRKQFRGATFWCGEVDAKNGFGGYVGWKPFMMTIDEKGKTSITIHSDDDLSTAGLLVKPLRERAWQMRTQLCGYKPAPRWISWF
jgi:hypothetical protein